nr:LytTR family DNA-binding domain-containing protein [uncultured Mediterraneibacter sp.]
MFHLTDGEQICYDTLKNIYKQLDHDIFMQIHQGFIANYNHVKEVLNDRVCFGSGMEAPLSRRYYDAIYGRYMDKLNRILVKVNTASNIK